jgi:hypothetical protein
VNPVAFAGFFFIRQEGKTGAPFRQVQVHEISNCSSPMKITQAFAVLLLSLAAARANDPAPSYYPTSQGAIGFETSLPEQVVQSLTGQRQALLQGQLSAGLPGQLVQPLPGQIVRALPGQIISSHSRYLSSVRNSP